MSDVDEITGANFLLGSTGRVFVLATLDSHQDSRIPISLQRSQESTNADGRRVGRTANVFDVQQLILTAERKEVSKERVEVRFRTQMKNLRIVRVINMRKYTQELTIDVLDGRRERRREVLAC